MTSGVDLIEDAQQVGALRDRILDPHRSRPIVVVTTGDRNPGGHLDAERIAAGIGPGCEVVVVPTGWLTYCLRDDLPDHTDVFGDAARVYPVGTAWHARPELARMHTARAGVDMHGLEQQVIADGRSALRAATAPRPGPTRRAAGPGSPAPSARAAADPRAMAPRRFPAVTPATLPGAPRVEVAGPRGSEVPVRHDPATAAAATAAARTGTGRDAGPVPGPSPSAAPTSMPGPTPARPSGPPRPPAPTPASIHRRPRVGSQVEQRPDPAGVLPGPVRGESGEGRTAPAAHRPRINGGQLWEAQSEADGRVLGRHLMAEGRTHPVVVVSTQNDHSPPILDADELFRRVGAIADVVVLRGGPAAWALAEEVPAKTQVYGGAGRVYPVDRGWLGDPYQAPLRFCWPSDIPARVLDTLEDDAYAAATIDGSLTQAAPEESLVRQASGKVDGFLDRHSALLRLRDSSQAIVVVDELVPGIEPERLLQPGMRLTGRVVVGLLGRFLPDPIPDDPAARLAASYRPGDLVLARITQVGARSAVGLLHPQVEVSIGTAEEDVDLRNLLDSDDVVTLEVTGSSPWEALLAHTDTPSVATAPVLPGGPPWLTEADLPQPALEPEEEPAAEEPPEAGAEPGEPPGAPSDGHGTGPAPSAGGPATERRGGQGAPGSPPPDPGAAASVDAALRRQVAALQAERDDLASRLQRTERALEKQKRAAGAAREDVKKLRNERRSQKDQLDAYRAQLEGADLFDDPAEQLRHDVYMAWLRRTPPAERPQWPLREWTIGERFLTSLELLEGISRAKVLDVLVEVITDRVKDIAGRDLHPLRDGRAGAQRVRGGAQAWRCALQVRTPSARRLHFWVLPGNRVELDQVGVHDDGI